ncbi:MAG TPA: hypothetical protein VKA18_13810 [Alphaproteobacteria bacterium]|nr:hypothetical protein [Alphaproteobacteria bacterium]
MPSNNQEGWGWFDTATGDSPVEPLRDDFVRTFGSGSGARVLTYLRQQTIERQVPPEAGEALLRHVEGQRQLVRMIERLASLQQEER